MADLVKTDSLVSGGNVIAPKVADKMTYRINYLHATGRGAKRMQELFLLAQQQGVTFNGSWEYKSHWWRTRMVLFNFRWTAPKATSESLDDAVATVIKSSRDSFFN